ncbi:MULTISPECIES: hypothetical protein [unclassified Roseibium]|uniref:hypothetical protein n=1 Tax=unclassified Roseibium TaxID=2629323 RepID=UPI00316FD209
MTDEKITMSPEQRKEAEEEAARIKRVADNTSAGGQLGGTFFGQEPDAGIAPQKPGSGKD